MEVTRYPAASGRLSAIPYPAQIRTLTSLRYLAAAWVVVFHWSAYYMDTPLYPDALVRAGLLGVDFFFVLSGFVLAHVYLARQRAGRLDYWNFLTRRIARIYPMHLMTLVGMIAFGLAARRFGWDFSGPWSPMATFELHSGTIFREVFSQVTLIHAWGAAPYGLQFNAPSWSISAEWFAYLTFPLATAALLPGRRHPFLVLLAVLALMMSMAAMFHYVMDLSLFSMTWNIGIIRIVPEFLLGIALYQVGIRYSLGLRGALAGTLACVVGPIALAYSGAPHAAIVLLLAALIWFVADAERHGGLAAICGRFPVLLGEVSYSVYMLHFGIGIALFGGVPNDVLAQSTFVALLQIAGGLVVVTLIAWILHITFELPVRSWINGHAGRIMQPADRP